jgi:glycosyltransferase involved in cell wall biosynthesis
MAMTAIPCSELTWQAVNPGSLFVVIPAYNEEWRVCGVVQSVKMNFPHARVVVVNDGSADATAEEAERGGAEVVRLPFNCGYGVALQTGLMYAKRQGAELVVTMDADGQHEPADIAKLIEPLRVGAADVTLGSRYLRESRSYRVPPVRRYASWCLSRIVSLLMGQTIHDTTTGFQGINAGALDTYLRLRDFPEKVPDADLLLYAHLNGCRVLELPVTMYADETGDSMHGVLKSCFYVPQMLVSIFGVLLAYNSLRK